jgi:hypothetical protein
MRSAVIREAARSGACMDVSKRMVTGCIAAVHLIAVGIFCSSPPHANGAAAGVESAIGIDGREKGSRAIENDFWIIDIDAVGQRLFLRPLLFKRFKPEAFEIQEATFHFPEEICSENQALHDLDDDVSIACVIQYLNGMMKNFIELDPRREGILSFGISIPFAIQSRYNLMGDDSENIRMYHLRIEYTYARVHGVMVRSLQTGFFKQLSSSDGLTENIESDWKKRKLIFRGDNSYYGIQPARDRD